MTSAETPVAEPHRLTRARDGRIVAGVCAGAADYFDIDPVIIRVILAVLAVFGGAGVVIYALAWVLIPEVGTPQTKLERVLQDRHDERKRDLVIVGVVVLVLLLVVGRHPFALRISGAVFLIVVVMTVAAVIGRWRTEHHAPTAVGPDQPAGQPPFASTVAPTAAMPTPWIAAPKPTRPHSWLGWLILGAAFFVAGAFSLVGLTGLAHPQPADVIAAVVAVIGIGLVIGAIRGRAWLMIPVGLLLIGLLGVADAMPRNLTWSSGTRTWSPVNADLASPYTLGAGDATLDLSNLAPSAATTIVGRVGAGRLIVLVPRGSAVAVHARVSAGRVVLFGHEQNGTGVDDRTDVAGPNPTAGTLTIDLQVGFGDVEVRDAPA